MARNGLLGAEQIPAPLLDRLSIHVDALHAAAVPVQRGTSEESVLEEGAA